jgi:spore protease
LIANQNIGQNTFMKTHTNLRTDMAAELLGRLESPQNPFEIKKSRVDVDKQQSLKINKPEGSYITIETGIVTNGLSSRYELVASQISSSIRELIPLAKNVLVVCLGNPNLTADALGSRVFENLNITRHLPKEMEKEVMVSAICPNVFGMTGIESFDIIKGVVERVKPQLVIAVDSLASAAVSRIASAFQLCSSGITPGSGVANHRMRLDKESLCTDVISIGVPLVVYATTIIAEAAGRGALKHANEDILNLIVTPKDIDILVEECAKVIASGINRTFVS